MPAALHCVTMDGIRRALASDPRIAFAVLFGSTVRGARHEESDVDIALGLVEGVVFGHRDIGDLISRLEREANAPIDLVLIDEAPPALAYRIFRDGVVVLTRDHRRLAATKAKAILEYLDFRPVEDLCARGVLAAAANGRWSVSTNRGGFVVPPCTASPLRAPGTDESM